MCQKIDVVVLISVFPALESFPKCQKKSITTHIPSYLHISQLWALQRAIHKLAS